MLTGRNLYGPCPGFQITTFPLTIGYLFCCGITTLTSKVANVVVVTKELKLEQTRTMIWKKIIYIHQNHLHLKPLVLGTLYSVVLSDALVSIVKYKDS